MKITVALLCLFLLSGCEATQSDSDRRLVAEDVARLELANRDPTAAARIAKNNALITSERDAYLRRTADLQRKYLASLSPAQRYELQQGEQEIQREQRNAASELQAERLISESAALNAQAAEQQRLDAYNARTDALRRAAIIEAYRVRHYNATVTPPTYPGGPAQVDVREGF